MNDNTSRLLRVSVFHVIFTTTYDEVSKYNKDDGKSISLQLLIGIYLFTIDFVSKKFNCFKLTLLCLSKLLRYSLNS